ncbi:MAG: hypothetical protein ACXWC9_01580 [Pseudobdellovibrionaceae bacterium]
MLDRIPRPLLVFAVLVLGIGLLFVLQKPHSVCVNQLELFKEAQAGHLYPRKVKASQRPALFPRLMDTCKVGNGPGACYELFTSMRKLLRDLQGSPEECLAPFGEEVEIRSALTKGTELLVMLAWGSQPPEQGLAKFGWLETLDLALFCQMKGMYLRVYGQEAWEQFRLATQAKLPGEAEKLEDGICVNCDSLKKAPAVLPAEEIWVRSLFSLRCDAYN